MKKVLLLLSSVFLFCSGAYSQTLLHYWNFNNSTSEAALLSPSVKLVAGASLTHNQGINTGGIQSAIQITSNTGQGFDVTNPNAHNGDAAATHLRFNNPVGGNLVFALPTTGYKDVVVKYATRRSGQGAHSQIIAYSVDGNTFTYFTRITPVDGNPTLQTLDFSAVPGVEDNPHFKIQISFEQGGGGLEGNNRFDNFSLEGQPTGSGNTDNVPPTIAFAPADNAVNIPTNVQPTLTFNEDIRLVDNSPITNADVQNLLELRLNDANGAAVSFDATISGRTITVLPTAALQNNQVYYLALKANVLEDTSDNALTTVQSVVFTTITRQTQFTPSDIVPVAYRMNATATEDEIALLTLVNILPGTLIHLTDAKYTDNTPAQCAGGLTWTAPAAGVAAGTIIRIQNDIATANIGSLTGSGFGLSSGGDQVIVYTGTPENPNFITALSSNAWLTTNTSCSGSNSKLPASLTQGQSAINLGTAPGNVAGNTVNAFYNGPQEGSASQLKVAILNPANWVGTTSGTAPQSWPVFAFPGPPAVVSASVLNQNTLQLTFSRDLNPASATDLTDFTGINGLQSIARSNNGTAADTLILTYATPFAPGSDYTLSVNGVQDTENRSMFSPFSFSFSYKTSIAFKDNFLSVKEDAGSIKVTLLIENPAASKVDLVLKGAPFSNTDATDFTYTNSTITLTGNSSTTQTITIPLNNDVLEEMDEYFVLSLENMSGLTLKGKQYLTVYIKDNDRKAPVPTGEIALKYVDSFKPAATGSTEIVVHDPISQRLFMTSAIEGRLDIADFSNPAAITLVKSIDMTPYGGITSVAVRNGVVAVASPAPIEQDNGSVVFFNTDGEFQKQVMVGALPDMITFSPDGEKILTANEGQPNDAYTIDPEGSISVIDMAGGLAALDQSKVTTISFAGFNVQEKALMAAGVRKLKAKSTLAQDFEPEYITISADSKKAWATLQENNAMAEIDLTTNTVTNIWPLGTKDFNAFGNGFDASDNSGVVHISNYPVKSYYIPDAVANFTVNNKTYLVTANEGDEKEYAGLTERTTVGAVNLDPTVFPNAAVLKESYNLGRLRITNLAGDTDKDGGYDELFMVGARSFSIWDAETKSQVYDSKDDFERYTAAHPEFAAIFNADNENNNFKSRSRAKGPEPEGVTVATINGATYAFVTLERIGGVMVYNITDPANAKLVDYKNNRSTTALSGDLGPEGIIYVSKENSPTGEPYIVIANELSGNISIFEIEEHTQTINFAAIPDKTFGDAPFPLSATASSGLPVSFRVISGPATINGNIVTLTSTGPVTIRAFQAGDSNYQAATAVDRSFMVKKAPQSISFAAISDKVYGDAPFELEATATSGLPVNFAVVGGPATVSGNKLTITGVGQVWVRATEWGNSYYASAEPVTRSFKVVAANNQTIQFAAIPDKVYGDEAVELVATATSGLPVSFRRVSGAVTIDGNKLVITGTSRVVVEAYQEGNTMYNPATPVSQSFTINKAPQSISFAAILDKVYGDAPFELQATSTSGLPVDFAVVGGPATVSGNKLTITGVGQVWVRATEWGNSYYASAEPVNRSFRVVAAQNQSIQFAATPDKGHNEAALDLQTNPNPFFKDLTVEFSLEQTEEQVVLEILTLDGKLLKTLHKGRAEGKVRYTYQFNGEQFASGMYLCHLIYKDKSVFKRILLAK